MKLRLLALAIALLAVMTQGTAIAQSRASQPQSITIDTQTVKQKMQEVQNYLHFLFYSLSIATAINHH